MGAMLRDATPDEWEDTLGLLRRADLSGMADRLPPGQESFFRAVEMSFNALAPERQERYKVLAVLLEDMAVPLPILRTLWGVNDARQDESAGNSPIVPWPSAKGKLVPSACTTLQLDYVRAQYPDRQSLDLTHGAVRLSSCVIEIHGDPKQSASQMVGRLLPYQELPEVRKFNDSVVKGAPRPLLGPLTAALTPPGEPQARSLTGHSSDVNAVAVTPDGKQAVSASWDGTLKGKRLRITRCTKRERVGALSKAVGGSPMQNSCA